MWQRILTTFCGNLKLPCITQKFACTTDLWTDNVIHRHYLDLSAFWISNAWELQHTMLRCKVFPDKHKTGINIGKEIWSIFEEFGLESGNTPVTTDSGAN